MGWRIGWLGLLRVPLLDERWWGGLPWDPVQIPVLLTVLCLAGTRHERPVLCWLWALTLIPWWLWVLKDGPGLVIAALGSLAFAAMAVAVDRVSSERRGPPGPARPPRPGPPGRAPLGAARTTTPPVVGNAA